MVEITTVGREDGAQDVRFGGRWIGTVDQGADGWYAEPAGVRGGWHATERDAVYAVVHAHTGGGYITAPAEVPDAG